MQITFYDDSHAMYFEHQGEFWLNAYCDDGEDVMVVLAQICGKSGVILNLQTRRLCLLLRSFFLQSQNED